MISKNYAIGNNVQCNTVFRGNPRLIGRFGEPSTQKASPVVKNHISERPSIVQIAKKIFNKMDKALFWLVNFK